MGLLDEVNELQAQTDTARRVYHGVLKRPVEAPHRVLPEDASIRERVEHALYWQTYCTHQCGGRPKPLCQYQWCKEERQLLKWDLEDIIEGRE